MTTFKTFKQFVESADDLDLLRYEMFFRKEMNLTKAAAKRAVVWAVRNGGSKAIQPQTIPDDGWDHILDWADGVFQKSGLGKSIFDVRKGPMGLLSTEVLVVAFIANVMREKYGLELLHAPILESVEEFEELPFILALRKEFGYDKHEAAEAVEWMKGELEWDDLDDSVKHPIMDHFSDVDEDEIHPSLTVDEWLMDEIAKILKAKYNLDLRDIA